MPQDFELDSDGRGPSFFPGDVVFVKPLKMNATVIRQRLHFDGSYCFYGNLELLYEDGTKGISNAWQCERISLPPN